MPFREDVKRDAKERAHYQCVMCGSPYFLNVHHLAREADGGSNTIDNACFLCPNCHTWFGHDPSKREGIRDRRDWWCQRCAAMDAAQTTSPSVRGFDELFQEWQRGQKQEQQRLFDEMKEFVAAQFRQRAARASSANTIDELVTASSSTLGVVAGDRCPRCSHMAVVDWRCGNCGYVTDDS